MPPQQEDDSTPPPQLLMENVKNVKSQYLYDFLDDETKSTVSEACSELTESSVSTLASSENSTTTVSMTIEGIYTRDEIPRKSELPKDYGLSDVKQDQVLVRRRMNTPFEKKTDSEEAMFVPAQGLVGPTFFHADLDEHDDSDDEGEEGDDEEWKPRIYEERAILFQSVEHYEQLMDEPKLSKYFQSDNEKEQKKQDLEAILEKPRFGEQIIVQGVDAQQLAIGDIFEIEGGLSPLKVEITSPRLCCAWVDKRNGSPFGLAGVKRYCNKNGLGGFFGRVLVAGELRDGMKFVRTAHPHPKWTLEYISYALYGEGPKSYLMAGWAHWQRSKEELVELCQLQQLGDYEWKEEAEYIIKYWDTYRPEDKLAREAALRATLLGRLGYYDLINSKPLKSLQQYFANATKANKRASPQDYLFHVLVALVACIIFMFVLSMANKTPPALV